MSINNLGLEKNYFFQNKDKIHLFFSITVTGRCNCSCSYCHFYSNKDRKILNVDISDELFDNYIQLIKYIKENVVKNVQFRFSGGEPLILGDRLFQLANKAYNITGLKPYILTNGKLLNKEIIEKSIENNIGSYVVSMENPFCMDKGAVDSLENIKKIKAFNTKYLPIIPGVVIVKNSMFKNLSKICDFFYDEIGCIPTISELTYDAYESPTQYELEDLRNNIISILKKYFKETPLTLFPYIVPELTDGIGNKFLTELDFNNKYNINGNNMEEITSHIFEQLSQSYHLNNCNETNCEWHENCHIIKWLWKAKKSNATEIQKFNDYCNFKKTICSAFYEVLKN